MKAFLMGFLVLLSLPTWAAGPKCISNNTGGQYCVGDKILVHDDDGQYVKAIVYAFSEPTYGTYNTQWYPENDPKALRKWAGDYQVGFYTGAVPGYPGLNFGQPFMNKSGVQDTFIAVFPGPRGYFHYVVYQGDTQTTVKLEERQAEFRYSRSVGSTITAESHIFTETKRNPKNLVEMRAKVTEELQDKCKTLTASETARIENVAINFGKPDIEFKLLEFYVDCLPGVSGPHYHIDVDYKATATCLPR